MGIEEGLIHWVRRTAKLPIFPDKEVEELLKEQQPNDRGYVIESCLKDYYGQAMTNTEFCQEKFLDFQDHNKYIAD